MTVPFFDLTRQYEGLRTEIDGAVAQVLATQHFIGGPRVAEVEKELAKRVGVSHGIGVSSGTDALLVSLMALGVGPGDEVITSPFTFVSPLEAILRLGARPVLVDIDPRTFNLDPKQIESRITPRTRALLPVHLFGQAADMTAIMEIARQRNLYVVEDMAQALDAAHKGWPVGSFGDLGCVSFFPTKNLGAAGDGGMVFCDDDELARKVRILCRHGAEPKYHYRELGGNFRLDAIQAAILAVKLPHLSNWTAARRDLAAHYDASFSAIPGVRTPIISSFNRSVYNQYVLRVRDRDVVQQELQKRGIGTGIYYPEPLHTQPILGVLGHRVGDFPEAERACKEVLALPIFPELTARERRKVSEAFLEVIAHLDFGAS